MRVQGNRRPHADARRAVRSGRRPRAAGDRAEEPLRRRHAARRAAPPRCCASYPGRSRRCRSIPAPIAALRELAPGLPRGLVAERRYAHAEWHDPRAETRAGIMPATRCAARPHFLAYRVQDLPPPLPLLARHLLRPAAADLDGAHRRGPRPRRALRRPDDLRGLSAIILARPVAMTADPVCHRPAKATPFELRCASSGHRRMPPRLGRLRQSSTDV